MAAVVSKIPHYVLRLVGVLSVVFAGLGFWYNVPLLFRALPANPSAPHFVQAFYALSALWLACHATLLVFGIRFIRLKPTWMRYFTGLMIFEVFCFFAAESFWTSPGLGASLSDASGIASAGIVFQLVTLFPLWGPWLAHSAQKEMAAGPVDDAEVFFASEQVNRQSDVAWGAGEFAVIFTLTWVLISAGWRRLIGDMQLPSVVGFGVPIVLGVISARASVQARRTRRRKQIEKMHTDRLERGVCPRCEYSLRGLTANRCPECGQQLPEPTTPPPPHAAAVE